MANRHATGIPLPGERAPDPEHDLIERIHVSGAKQLASARDAEATRIGDLATEVTVATLLARAQHARHAERVAGHEGRTNPANLRGDLERAVTFREHAEIGRRVRSSISPNPPHSPRRPWRHSGGSPTMSSGLHVNGQRRSLLAASSLATPFASSARPTLRARARLTGCGLTLRSGSRTGSETDGPGAAVWDDSVARIAHHRAVHEIDAAIPGLGPQPPDPRAGVGWQGLMLRTLRDRIWLTDLRHEPQATRTCLSATAMHDRRAELQALMSTAPADHRGLIEHLTGGNVGSADVHEHLVAATTAQQGRRDWIVANWPHVVELEQLNALISTQPALAHWPTAIPPPVQAVLDAMASTASRPPSREQRTLATLDQEATANDPVRQAQAKIHDLDQLAPRASTSAERAAVDDALRAAHVELRQARREQHVDDVFARYGGSTHDAAVERRRLTVRYDILTDPPNWVIEHLRRAHDDGRLGATCVDRLATRIVGAAVHLDRNGYLPDGWADVEVRPANRPLPVVEIDVPGL